MSILVGRHTLKEIPSETVQEKMICNRVVARQLRLGEAKYVEETDNFFFIGQITMKQCVCLNVEGSSEEPQVRSGFNFKCKSWLSVARLLLTFLFFLFFFPFFVIFCGLRTDDKVAFEPEVNNKEPCFGELTLEKMLARFFLIMLYAVSCSSLKM